MRHNITHSNARLPQIAPTCAAPKQRTRWSQYRRDRVARSSDGAVYRSDSCLIQACLDGEDAAWRELVDRYGRLVYSVALRYGLSAVDVDDVFQNVFTIVFNQLAQLRNQKLLAAWLITITWR